MIRIICLLACVWLPTGMLCAEDVPAKKSDSKKSDVELKTTRDQASYAIGQNIGKSIKNDGLELNTAALVQGLMDAIGDVAPKLTEQQSKAALEALSKDVTTRMEQKARVEGEKNKKEGDAFLAANKGKAGVVTLPSGLQYVVLKAGKGATPKLTDRVKTHYHGTLISGKVFDSSVQRGEPISFPVGGVIRGWTEALQKMKVGDKWKLFVPGELAYGPAGAGADIGPNAVLVFEVELLGIEPPM